MKLSAFSRARVAVERPSARWLVRSATLRRFWARSRREPVDGEVVDEEIAAMLGLDDFMQESDLRGLSPSQARARVAREVALATAAPPPGVSVTEHRFVSEGHELGARLYLPEALETPSPALVYIHGGGWVTGDLDTHDALCQRLAAVGRLRVVSLEYRLAPEHPFPAAVLDAHAGFRWVASAADELGIDRRRIGIGGDSAGGNLSAVVSLRSRSDSVRPALQVPLYAAFDASCSMRSHALMGDRWFLTSAMVAWYYGHYLGEDAALRKHPDASPIAAADVSGVPPALIYVAHFDTLRDEAFVYADRLKAAGVPVRVRVYGSLIHGFLLMTELSSAASEATDEVAREVGEALRGTFSGLP
jgi:acetyl esterase